MMRSLIIGICLLLVLLIFIFCATIYLENNMHDFLSLLNQSRQMYYEKDYSASEQTIELLAREFEKKRHVFSIFINHNELSKADFSLLKIKAFIKNQDTSNFEAEYGVLAFVFENIHSSEVLSLSNLF